MQPWPSSVVVPPDKLKMDVLTRWLTANPAKNHAFHMLLMHARMLRPSRSLDAGAGELRNFWMFPKGYTGIALSPYQLRVGLERPPTPELTERGWIPDLYAMRLQSDFSFLGTFDFAVSTNTLVYVPEYADVAARMSDRVREGGSMIITDDMPRLDDYVRVLAPHYKNLVIFYWGYGPCVDYLTDMPLWDYEPVTPRFRELTELELSRPNTPDGHKHFYLIASKKKSGPGPEGPKPDMSFEAGVHIVNADRPHLLMDS